MSTYQESVDHHLAGLEFVSSGLCATCATCQHDYDLDAASLERELDRGLADEGGFSWVACESCGSTFGGSRYAAHGIATGVPGSPIIHFRICEDCLVFLSDGDEPDGWHRSPSEETRS